MYIPDFNYHKPHTLKEACSLLEQSENAAPLAGGTDLLVEIKQGLRQHKDIISLTAIEELQSINFENSELHIGAGVTHGMVARSEVILNKFPAIAYAASKIGSEQVRNTGTIGGNLCTAASCCDIAPVLMVLNARLEIVNSKKSRIIPLKDFFTFHRETIIENGEILTKIIIPKSKPNTYVSFEKFGLREAVSISVASVAVKIELTDGICSNASVVIGAVAPTPKISDKASKALIDKNISDLVSKSSCLKDAGKGAVADSLPIDDIRGTAEYRRNVISVITQRAILKAANQAKNS